MITTATTTAIVAVVVTLVLLPALGVWLLSRFISTGVEDSLRSGRGFEPRHFEIGPEADRHVRLNR